MLPPKVIIAALDLTEHSATTLKTAEEFALHFGSQLCLVHVVPALPDLPSEVSVFKESEYENALHTTAEKKLAEMAGNLSTAGVNAKYAVGTANDTAMEIIRLAEHHQGDLIIIGTHGHSAWHEMAFGTVVEKVVRLSAIPVLVLRSQAEAQSSDATPKAESAAAAS
jgi:nucleotide-binding universal stress UspA family protein